MKVTLNEPALERLLDSQEGPVGQFVAGIAAQVVSQAQQNVRNYYFTAPSLTVDQDVGFSMEGSDATIGIRDGGSKSQLLAEKQSDGRINWLLDALQAARR